MNVQETIDALMAIEDKSLPVKFVMQYNDLQGEELDTIFIDQYDGTVRLGN